MMLMRASVDYLLMRTCCYYAMPSPYALPISPAAPALPRYAPYAYTLALFAFAIAMLTPL